MVWIYAGRILIGFSSGSYSLIAPMYTDEIAEKEIIGILGTYFEKQVYIGAFFIYVLGYYVSFYCKNFNFSFKCHIYFID